MEPRRVEHNQRIPSELAATKGVVDRFMIDLERQEYDSATAFALALGFCEAVANAFNHGNQRDPAKSITVCYRLDTNRAELEVRDEGSGFDPCQIPDATTDDGIDRPGGRGVLLMRTYFDDVQFLLGGRGVRLTKQVAPTNERAA